MLGDVWGQTGVSAMGGPQQAARGVVHGLERSLSAHRMRPSAFSLLGPGPQGDQAQGLISARDRGSMSSPLCASRLI